MNLMAKYKAYLFTERPEEQKPLLQIITPRVDNSTKITDNTDKCSLIIKAPPLKSIRKNTTAREIPPIWRNPFPQGTPEARQESLNQILQALYNSATERGGGIPARIKNYINLNEREDELIPLWQNIINGNAKVKDFSDYMESKWMPALVAANRLYKEALVIEAEERFCIQNEATI